MHLHQPHIDLIGGPMDGLTNHGAAHYQFEKVNVLPGGEVAARILWPDHPESWLLYGGEFAIAGGRSKLGFVDYMPVNLTPAQ